MISTFLINITIAQVGYIQPSVYKTNLWKGFGFIFGMVHYIKYTYIRLHHCRMARKITIVLCETLPFSLPHTAACIHHMIFRSALSLTPWASAIRFPCDRARSRSSRKNDPLLRAKQNRPNIKLYSSKMVLFIGWKKNWNWNLNFVAAKTVERVLFLVQDRSLYGHCLISRVDCTKNCICDSSERCQFNYDLYWFLIPGASKDIQRIFDDDEIKPVPYEHVLLPYRIKIIEKVF